MARFTLSSPTKVSTDGRTLTSRSSGTLEQVIVFDRD